jgi:hypothetical protein
MDDAGPSLQGQAVSQRYNVGFIVLSCFVSVIGCWTALELLHKRTTTRGYYNWYVETLPDAELVATTEEVTNDIGSSYSVLR